MAAEDRRFAAADITRFNAAAFMALGVPESDAVSVAELMVEADLTGYDTHGTFRLRQYMNRLRDGGTNARAQVTIAQDQDATAIFDGDNGLGHLARHCHVNQR
jgi:LDH2 family malate/lactate/ureidoglycolate dehydrogenase